MRNLRLNVRHSSTCTVIFLSYHLLAASSSHPLTAPRKTHSRMLEYTYMLLSYTHAYMLISQAEKEMELMKELIHGGRSLRSDYKLANHIKADFYYTCTSSEMRGVINSWGQDFCTLARANQLIELESNSGVKKGFCVKVISDQISLFIDLTEIIDVTSEILRLNKERERLELSIDTYVKKTSVSNYETKVPESIRIVNSEKITSFELELEATIKAISSFELMKA